MNHHCLPLRGRHIDIRAAVAAGLVALFVPACAVGGAAPAPSHPPASPVHPGGSRPSPARAGGKLLAGITVGIDPGHNGGNFRDPAYIDRLIWNGREWETCNTTGTETATGYTEARFNFSVAMFLRTRLLRDRARVVMTRDSNHGVGPCVSKRAQILSRSHAAVAIAIHADGAPPGGRGFAVLEPVADGPNDANIGASQRFGRDVRAAMLADTTMPVSTYDGVDGIAPRDNLAGLNLVRVPEVLIECGNMKNPADAALLVSAGFQRRIARALEAAIITFLGR